MGIIPSPILFRTRDIFLIFNIQNNHFLRPHKGYKTAPGPKDIQSNIYCLMTYRENFSNGLSFIKWLHFHFSIKFIF